jgi:hypothetical protein
MKKTRNGSEQRTPRETALAWAAVLVGGSLLLLVYNLNLLARFEPVAGYIVAGALALGGVALLLSVIPQPAGWWRLIPAWTLLALAAMVLLAQSGSGRWIAALLLIGMAIAFLNIFLLNRTAQWWALLPAGFMAVLGLVVGISGAVTRLEVLGAILFAGLGAVFLLLALMKVPQDGRWATIPGSILLLFGFFVLTMGAGEGAFWARWWPLAPLAAGLVAGWLTFARRGEREKLTVNRAPAPAAAPKPLPSAASSPSPTADLSSTTPAERSSLGHYTQPAPGATVQVLPDE